MATCGACHRSDLHHEYMELRGLGWRPVLCHEDGTRHRCMYDGSLPLRDTSTPKPRGQAPVAPPKPKPAAPPTQPPAIRTRCRTIDLTVKRG
jgi:hypothetical protein